MQNKFAKLIIKDKYPSVLGNGNLNKAYKERYILSIKQFINRSVTIKGNKT